MAAVLSPLYAFGLKKDVIENVCFIDEQTIAYPVGSVVVVHNLEHNTQKFLSNVSSTSAGFTAMTLSANKRFLAIAERGERASVVIFDLHFMKKKRVCNFFPF